jgi:putative pyruvate formate lyase activating enzyme
VLTLHAHFARIACAGGIEEEDEMSVSQAGTSIGLDELCERAAHARERLKSCTLCPRQCRVDRAGGETGFCGTGASALVASYGPHFGEEPPLVGRYGSGTIFFCGCNLGCIFCQNYDISHLREGSEVSAEELAAMMLSLQKGGRHNINLVTPTHVVPQILEALVVARAHGLTVPLVYNCGGYESVETLELLDGVIDIYMPDAKYSDDAVSTALCDAPDYWDVCRAALKEMHRQVGDLQIDARGIATRGLLVRHLVLPEGLAGTFEVMRFLAQEISENTYVNIMEQYRPCYRANEDARLRRRITMEEFAEALEEARKYGLHRGF